MNTTKEKIGTNLPAFGSHKFLVSALPGDVPASEVRV